VGMVLLLLALLLNVPFSQRVAPAAGALIKHISLLIFPLGVGIVLQWHRYEDYALALGVAVVLGTLLSLVLVTLMLKKLLGGKHGESAGGRHDG
ncbi:murein hydrolase transporter LrgA, partial [Alcanivorax sp. HI0013]